MRRIVYGYSKRQQGMDNALHIETPLGIINIYAGLHDTHGREVIGIYIMPDSYNRVRLYGKPYSKLVKLNSLKKRAKKE